MKKRQNRGGSESLHLKRQLRRLRAKFETEKNAKNEVYYFILSQGLLDRYRAFNAAHRGEGDYFQLCFNHLIDEELRRRGY